jgi:hypothetical protein
VLNFEVIFNAVSVASVIPYKHDDATYDNELERIREGTFVGCYVLYRHSQATSKGNHAKPKRGPLILHVGLMSGLWLVSLPDRYNPEERAAPLNRRSQRWSGHDDEERNSVSDKLRSSIP